MQWILKKNVCKISGTVYGKGVYFARDASYSVKDYCPVDDNGYSYLYYCMVLTGEYVKGSTDMIVPPVKGDPQNSVIHYDSTVDEEEDPSVYAVYYDHQAYPLYQITLNDKV